MILKRSIIPDMPDQSANRRLLDLFAHPIVGLTGVIASVVGVVLAIYFYLGARAEPAITVYISPARSAIVAAGEVSALSVSYRGQPITSDMTAVQIALWNDGKQGVRGTDILEPVLLRTGVPIWEARIRKLSRRSIGLELDRSRMASGVIPIKWNILERGDGGIVQLIYAGDPSREIAVSGAFVGQRSIVLHAPERIMSPSEAFAATERSGNWIYYLSIATGTLFALFAVGMAIAYARDGDRIPKRFIAYFIGGIAYAVFGLVLLIRRPPGPPFGF